MSIYLCNCNFEVNVINFLKFMKERMHLIYKIMSHSKTDFSIDFNSFMNYNKKSFYFIHGNSVSIEAGSKRNTLFITLLF